MFATNLARARISHCGRLPRIYFRQDKANNAPIVLTVPEASNMLRVSKWTLYQLIRSRQLDTIKIGRRRVVPVAAIQAYVDRLQAEGLAQ